MNVKIDHLRAEEILRSIVNEVKSSYQVNSLHTKKIKDIILGPHKTYRYIFINALLAKATESLANPLVLQAGSSLKGAFDARSLCHKVLVKVERDIMSNSLGGSNEPFLNKPARYKELSTSNAVRKGNDSELLNICIDVLSSINSSEDALLPLKDAIYYSFLRNPVRKLLVPQKNINLDVLKINKLIIKLLEDSCGGESCAIISAIAFEFLGINSELELKIELYPINQAGNSSKGVSDIDVYLEKNLIYTAEIKDRLYTIDDLDHAARKVFDNTFDRLLFLKGPNANLSGDDNELDIVEKWALKGVDIFLGSVFDFTSIQIYLAKEVGLKQVVEMINKYSASSKVSDNFINHAKICIKNL